MPRKKVETTAAVTAEELQDSPDVATLETNLPATDEPLLLEEAVESSGEPAAEPQGVPEEKPSGAPAPVEAEPAAEQQEPAEELSEESSAEPEATTPAQPPDEEPDTASQPTEEAAAEEPEPTMHEPQPAQEAEPAAEPAKPAKAPAKKTARRREPKKAKTPEAAPSAAAAPAPRGVLTVEANASVETQEDKDDIAWHDLQNAARTRRVLTGVLGGIERMESGGVIAVVYYKDTRVVIPVGEMMLTLSDPAGSSYGAATERQSKLLNNMMSCEIDFVVKGLDSKARSVVASRKEAMLRKRRTFYLQLDASGQPQVRPGRVVQARVVAVASKVVRVEIFGVETSILARDLSWEWVGDAHERFRVGDKILVKVNEVQGDSLENLRVKADAKSLTANTVLENLARCKVQGKYAGTVTDVRKGVVYVRLAIGVNAVAHSCYDTRMPAKGDCVSFAATRVDAEHGVAVGIITRIIRQMI